MDSLITKLESMWDRIQELKQTDALAAQIMYEKYKKIEKELEAELPPEIPEPWSTVVEDQAVS